MAARKSHQPCDRGYRRKVGVSRHSLYRTGVLQAGIAIPPMRSEAVTKLPADARALIGQKISRNLFTSTCVDAEYNPQAVKRDMQRVSHGTPPCSLNPAANLRGNCGSEMSRRLFEAEVD